VLKAASNESAAIDVIPSARALVDFRTSVNQQGRDINHETYLVVGTGEVEIEKYGLGIAPSHSYMKPDEGNDMSIEGCS